MMEQRSKDHDSCGGFIGAFEMVGARKDTFHIQIL